MQMNIVVLIISMLLFFVLFFGIGFVLNMLLRMSWIMAIIYPIIGFLIIDEVRFIEYFTNTLVSLSELLSRVIHLAFADILILACGWGGAVVAGITIKALRKRGYQMF
jgi:Putative membrane protein